MCHPFGSGQGLQVLSSEDSCGSGRFSFSSRGTQKSTSVGAKIGNAGRAAIGRIGRVIASGVGVKCAAFGLVAMTMLMFGAVDAMAQTTPTTPTTPDLPVFVDFEGLVNAIIEGIQSYLGLVVVGIIALSLVTGFLAWTVGRRKLG